jgi:hypothetical protein
LALNHLSDNDIQDFLDGNLPEREAQISRHCRECQSCREEIETYRLIYGQLPALVTEESAPDLCHRVLSALHRDSHLSGRAAVWDRLTVFAAAAACLAVSVLLLGWSTLARLTPDLIAGLRSFAQLADLAGLGLVFDDNSIVFAALALLVLMAADRLLRKHRRSSAASGN